MEPRRSDRAGRGADTDHHPLPGFTNRSYGAGFADVYDDWYGEVSPVDSTVSMLADLAGNDPVLELGIGTGRLALPLASRIAPNTVWGIDSSPEMLEVLAENDTEQSVTIVVGDMAEDLPDGPFSLVFAAYNTLFNLDQEKAQRQCFANVAARLSPGGRFVIEAFVPDEVTSECGDERDQQLEVRSMTASAVVLSVSRNDPASQRAGGHFIELRDGEPVRLRPWAIRYATVAELDTMANEAGLRLEHRWASTDRAAFTAESTRHLSVYRAATLTTG